MRARLQCSNSLSSRYQFGRIGLTFSIGSIVIAILFAIYSFWAMFDRDYETHYQIMGLNEAVYQGPFLTPPYFSVFDLDRDGKLSFYVPNVANRKALVEPLPPLPAGNPFKIRFYKSWRLGPMAVVKLPFDNILPKGESGKTIVIPDDFYTRLFTDFKTFLAYLTTLENPSQGKPLLNPGGARVLAQRIAANIPLRYDQVPRFTQMLDSATRSADLQAGQKLDVDFEMYQVVGPNANLATYVGTGNATFPIVSRTNGQMSFGPFLREMIPYQLSGQPEQTPRNAGLVDFGANLLPYPFLRMVYPPTVMNINPGLTAPTSLENMVIIGANSYQTLEQATKEYLAQSGSLPRGSKAIFFSGRSAATLKIRIIVDGQSRWVPMGTRLSDILEETYSVTTMDLQQSTSGWWHPMTITMQRQSQASLRKPSWFFSSNSFFSHFNIDLSTQVLPFTNVPENSIWDLPLVSGDRIDTGIIQQ